MTIITVERVDLAQPLSMDENILSCQLCYDGSVFYSNLAYGSHVSGTVDCGNNLSSAATYWEMVVPRRRELGLYFCRDTSGLRCQ